MDVRKLTMEFEAQFINVDIARSALQGICTDCFGKDSESASDIVMAANEAMNNAVEHAGAATVKIEVFWDLKELRLSVISGGARFDPVAAVSDLNCEDMLERDEGGYGIYLIRELVDSFEYEYHDSSNIWKLCKYINH